MDHTVIENHLNDLFEKYVPASGKADTVGGELVRASMRLLYRFFNDGDKAYEGYGNITCNGSFRYIKSKISYIDDLYGDRMSDDEYETQLYQVIADVLEYLDEHPEVFEKKNTEDSREVSKEDHEAEQEYYAEDEDEYYNDDDYEYEDDEDEGDF